MPLDTVIRLLELQRGDIGQKLENNQLARAENKPGHLLWELIFIVLEAKLKWSHP